VFCSLSFFWLNNLGRIQWRQRISAKITVVGMLVFEVVFGLKLGILVVQNFSKLVNNIEDLLVVKMPANPDNETLNLIQWLFSNSENEPKTFYLKRGRALQKVVTVEFTEI